MCREMAELVMDLARDTAHAARQEWPEPPPANHTPTAPQPRPAQAPRHQTRRTDSDRHEHPSPIVAFTRLVAAFRQIVTLEIQLAAIQQAETDRNARLASNRAFGERHRAEARQTPQPSPTHPHTPKPTATPREIPSLLSTLSQDLGLDLEDPTWPDRLSTRPRPAPETQPTGPPD